MSSLLHSKGDNTEDYTQKTRKVCNKVIKCKPTKEVEMTPQDDGQSDSLILILKQLDLNYSTRNIASYDGGQ